MLGRIFGWTSGATIGTLFTIAKRGELIGTDETGNKYYQSRDTVSYDGRKRRWVVYNGYAEASAIPPGWHGWMHHRTDVAPSQETYVAKDWQKAHKPNLTGTPQAYRPPGSLAVAGERPRVTGDYDAWTPGN